MIAVEFRAVCIEALPHLHWGRCEWSREHTCLQCTGRTIGLRVECMDYGPEETPSVRVGVRLRRTGLRADQDFATGRTIHEALGRLSRRLRKAGDELIGLGRVIEPDQPDPGPPRGRP